MKLNLIKRGANYGYPLASNGNHYDGRPIPEHSTRPRFASTRRILDTGDIPPLI